VGTRCLGFGGGPNKEVDYSPPSLRKLIILVPRLGTNELIFRIAKNSGKICACYAKNLIEVLKHNNCVTWKKSYAMFW